MDDDAQYFPPSTSGTNLKQLRTIPKIWLLVTDLLKSRNLHFCGICSVTAKFSNWEKIQRNAYHIQLPPIFFKVERINIK